MSDSKTVVKELYERYGPMVYRRCLAILKDEEAAYDGLQEVFLKIVDRPQLLEGLDSPLAYLFRIATNHCLDQLRKNRFRAAQILEEGSVGASDSEDGLAADIIIDLLSAGMNRRWRAIAYYRYVDGLSLDEIAEQVGLSKSAVRRQLDGFKEKARRHKERIV